MRAARVAAGYVVAKDAADAMSIPMATYRAAEASNAAQLSESLMIAACNVFGASLGFLSGDAAETPVDHLAARIGNILQMADDPDAEAGQGEVAVRLKKARQTAGYRTASEAAEKNSWPLATYSSHENCYSPIPIERQVAYALEFHVRPEYLTLGLPPMAEVPPIEWKDLRANDALPKTDTSAGWLWLKGRSKQGLAVLALVDGKLRVEVERLSVPEALLRGRRLSGTGHCYVFAKGDGEGWLIDATASAGKLVFLGDDGRAYIDESAVEVRLAPDPIRKRKPGVSMLGGYIGRLTVAFDG